MFLILLIGVFCSMASVKLAAAGDLNNPPTDYYLLTSVAIGNRSANSTPVDGGTPLMARGNSSFPNSQDSTVSPPSLFEAPPVIIATIALNAAEVKVLFEQASKSCRFSANSLQIKAGKENCFAKLAVAILHKMGRTGPEIDNEKAALYLSAYSDLFLYKENILEVQLYWRNLLIQHELLTCEKETFCR